jgi:WD40 repeat protein
MDTKEGNTVLKGHQGAANVVKFNTEGAYCVSGGADKTLRLWNPFKGNLIQTYRFVCLPTNCHSFQGSRLGYIRSEYLSR